MTVSLYTFVDLFDRQAATASSLAWVASVQDAGLTAAEVGPVVETVQV